MTDIWNDGTSAFGRFVYSFVYKHLLKKEASFGMDSFLLNQKWSSRHFESKNINWKKFNLFAPFASLFFQLCAVGITHICLRMWRIFFVFQGFLIFFADPTQADWWGWVLIGLIFVTDLLALKFEVATKDRKVHLTFSVAAYLQTLVLRKVMVVNRDKVQKKVITKLLTSAAHFPTAITIPT
jgi:hypothetical protein